MRIVLLLALLTGGCAMTTQRVVEQAVSHHVKVETDHRIGSGVILQTDLVLTVFHMAEVDSNIRVEGVVAEILVVDPKDDLLILGVKTPIVQPIETSSDVSLLEEVVAIGNPLDLYGVVSLGRIVKIDSKNDFIYTDNVVMPGFSGGGLYNLRGQLLGTIVAMKGAEAGTQLMMVVPITRAARMK